jgi:hypothetical protein
MTTTGYQSIDQIKSANRAAGQFFFEPATLRFFQSRIGRTVYRGKYFVTSEQFVDSRGVAHARKFTIRVAGPDGEIDTVGEFQAYDTSAEAIRAIKLLPE